MSDRSENIRFKVMPDGNIRCYQGNTADKRGVSELMITNPRNPSATVTTTNGGGKTYVIIENDMKKRDFHKEVRVVYRACRKKYGIDKTQDECLRVFKVVYPELYKLKNSDADSASVPVEVRNRLYGIIRSWKPQGGLKAVIDKAESWIDLPMECGREELIQFYEDILPVVMRIRKLTPKECLRLMDVDDKDIEKMMNCGISNSALYKCAGNSIVVSCLYYIFRNMFVESGKRAAGTQLSLW